MSPVTGVASLAVRDLLRGPRRAGRVLAVLPQAIYLEFPDSAPAPRVLSVSYPDAIRLPNAVVARYSVSPATGAEASAWTG